MTSDRLVRKAAPAYRCRLVIMVKLPVAGRVKTRLAREVGVVEATRFYRSMCQTIVGMLGAQPFWETHLLVTPDTGLASAMLPGGPNRLVQGRGDLGARMQRPMQVLGPGPVCVMGTDIPAVGVTDVRQAFRLLGARDVVFGPAEDGGFWLVGMRRRPRLPNPYQGIRWSAGDTLDQVVHQLDGYSIGLAARHGDVDEACDLARFKALLGRRIRPVKKISSG
ncbi:MAG: DUF2064 domain-containing protein [Hyphomicrobiaceae bacterium]